MELSVNGQGIGDEKDSDDFQSIEDVVRAAYEEHSKEKSDDDLSSSTGSTDDSADGQRKSDEAADSSDGNTEQEPSDEKVSPNTESDKTVKAEEPIAPPTDWTAEAKEWFKSAPKEVQAEHKRIADQFQSYRHKEIGRIKSAEQELSTKYQEIEGAVNIVRRFLPIWGVSSKTPESALTELCTFNDLAIKDPDTALENLAKATGRQIQILNRKDSQSPQNQQTVDYDSIYAKVKSDLSSEFKQNQIATQTQTVAQQVDEALSSLQGEVSEQGKYIYPDLHKPEFQRELEPLALGISQANPNLAWRDVLLRAYKAAEGRIIPRNVPAKLNGNANTRLSTLKRAASSSSGSYGSSTEELEVIPNETVEQTVARAFQFHSNR